MQAHASGGSSRHGRFLYTGKGLRYTLVSVLVLGFAGAVGCGVPISAEMPLQDKCRKDLQQCNPVVEVRDLLEPTLFQPKQT